jgi:hypothetical protein
MNCFQTLFCQHGKKNYSNNSPVRPISIAVKITLISTNQFLAHEGNGNSINRMPMEKNYLHLFLISRFAIDFVNSWEEWKGKMRWVFNYLNDLI